MPTYTEEDFEDHIEAHLNGSRYHSRQPVLYNKDLCLIPNETLKFYSGAHNWNEYQKTGTSSTRTRTRRLTFSTV